LRLQTENFRKFGEQLDDSVRYDALEGELDGYTGVAEEDKSSRFHLLPHLVPSVDDIAAAAGHGGAMAFLLGQDSWGADGCPSDHYEDHCAHPGAVAVENKESHGQCERLDLQMLKQASKHGLETHRHRLSSHKVVEVEDIQRAEP
jgi:hypothetical protein